MSIHTSFSFLMLDIYFFILERDLIFKAQIIGVIFLLFTNILSCLVFIDYLFMSDGSRGGNNDSNLGNSNQPDPNSGGNGGPNPGGNGGPNLDSGNAERNRNDDSNVDRFYRDSPGRPRADILSTTSDEIAGEPHHSCMDHSPIQMRGRYPSWWDHPTVRRNVIHAWNVPRLHIYAHENLGTGHITDLQWEELKLQIRNETIRHSLEHSVDMRHTHEALDQLTKLSVNSVNSSSNSCTNCGN